MSEQKPAQPDGQRSKVISVAIPRPIDRLFSYSVEEEAATELRPGSWVKVPFGRSTTHGFVVDEPKSRDEISEELKKVALKKVLERGEADTIIPPDVFELCRWAAKYYQTPLGEVFGSAIPAAALGLRNKKREPRKLKEQEDLKPTEIKLTEEQTEAKAVLSDLLKKDDAQTALLEGVTGSGKTEVYIEVAKEALAAGRGVLMLVPEIALTPQLYERIERGLGERVVTWHSAMADGQRRDVWSALMKGEARVVVGARSALFTPIKNLGLVVVDEEHDSSYKQEERFRYQARDLAKVRARMTNSLCVLGSATPSLESLEACRRNKSHHLFLKNRFSGHNLPEVKILNLTDEDQIPDLQAPFAKKTIEKIQETLDSGSQVMIFLNRRGFAAFLLCEDCGEVSQCENCSVSLTVHKKTKNLKCHLCGFQKPRPLICENCDGHHLVAMGAGTESLEEQLPHLLQGAKIARLDRDQVTSSKRLNEILQDFRENKTNLLLGTQMLVKGHDFPNVTLVVVVLADALFRWPEFRAQERAYQILHQVAGRAGRGEKPGEVWIQTFSPNHPVLSTLQTDPALQKANKEAFLENERSLREELNYPPYGRLARIRVEAKKQENAQRIAQSLASGIQQSDLGQTVQILGPTEAIIERIKNTYRWEFLVRTTDVVALQRALSTLRRVAEQREWTILVDVDPS